MDLARRQRLLPTRSSEDGLAVPAPAITTTATTTTGLQSRREDSEMRIYFRTCGNETTTGIGSKQGVELLSPPYCTMEGAFA